MKEFCEETKNRISWKVWLEGKDIVILNTQRKSKTVNILNVIDTCKDPGKDTS